MSAITDVLNDLITVSKDGEAGFNKAAEETTDENLKSTFTKRAKGCTHAIAELQRHVENLGGTPADNGSVLGALHRGWLDIKSAVMDRDAHAILAECERGEDVAKATYAKALKADLTANIRELIEKQYAVVKRNHDLVRDLRDQYAKKK